MTEKTYTLTINVTYNVEDDAQHEKIKARLDMLPLQLFASGEFYLGVPLVSYDHQVEDNPKLIKRVLDVSTAREIEREYGLEPNPYVVEEH